MPLRSRIAALLLALLLPACLAVEVRDDVAEGPTPAEDAGGGGLFGEETPAGEPTVEAPQEGQDLEVPLEVVEGPGGAILAFVPVEVDGQGPYGFALDTGASTSVLDRSIAEELGLEQVGEAQGVTGVTGATEAAMVQIESWQMGEVDLGARPALVLDLGTDGAGPGIEGLLGSDVLSEFGAITVDYDEQVLRLRPREG